MIRRLLVPGCVTIPAAMILLGLSLLLGGSPSLVDWRASRVVVIESDDWGLCGYAPDAAALAGVELGGLRAGKIPAAYLNSTLEDSAAVASLAAVLAAFRGRDGGPAVLQPNYIMGWQDVSTAADVPGGVSISTGCLPDLPALYQRPGLWPAVAEAVGAGVWYPEYHGLWHYDPDSRAAVVARDPLAAAAAERGILVFQHSNRSFELGEARAPAAVAGELAVGLKAFTQIFGRRPDAVVAPDYLWSRRHELMWRAAGLTIIQSRREQRHPDYESTTGRLRKVLAQSLRRLTEHRLVYLDRNVRLETAQVGDPDLAASRAARRVRLAWRRGEPAVVESHRVNYAHLDAAIAAGGRRALSELLSDLGSEPLYLTDVEVAGLARAGTSWRRAGNCLWVRNLTHSRRPLLLPGGRVVHVGPGESLRFDWPTGSAAGQAEH